MSTRTLNWTSLGFVFLEHRHPLWVPEAFSCGIPPFQPLESWAPDWLIAEVEGRRRDVQRAWGRAHVRARAKPTRHK